MIFEYRGHGIKRTYKDVTNVETKKGGVTYLFGTTPAEMDYSSNQSYPVYLQLYAIAVINLAPGEYLERVDLPRD